MALVTNMKGPRIPARERFKKGIQLISSGYYAPQNFPEGKLTVYPWDSDVDDWAQDRMRSGMPRHRVLFEILGRVADLRGLPVDKFLAGEVNLVLMVARAILTDSEVEYLSVCPKCATKEPSKVRIPEQLEVIGAKTVGYPDYDEIILPVCKDVIRLQPLRIGDISEILERDIKEQRAVSTSLATIVKAIATVNESRADTLREMLEYVLSLDLKDREFLDSQQEKLTPHLDQRVEHVCENCKAKYHHALQIDADFFRRGERSPEASASPAPAKA